MCNLDDIIMAIPFKNDGMGRQKFPAPPRPKINFLVPPPPPPEFYFFAIFPIHV